MIIIGAGMAGLLAGGMIRDQKVTIYESAQNVPNNHSAVLRFRSSIVGDALGIEFKPVQMLKCVDAWRNPVADSLAYSLKCNGKATLRSILSANAETQTRYIAPMNLISLMAERINGTIKFNSETTLNMLDESDEPVISTIPMLTLMKMLNYPDIPHFKFVHGYNINAAIENMDAYATVYVPSPDYGFNRVSATGYRMTMEYSLPKHTPHDISAITDSLINNTEMLRSISHLGAKILGIEEPIFGSIGVSSQKYSKILPIDEKIRRHFIMWASENYNIYSLGRYATWRPGLLLDDLVNDVRVIQKIIKNDSYDYRKKG